MPSRWLLAVALGLSCAHRPAAAPDRAPSWSVSERAAGPLRIGMTVAEVGRALGTAFQPAYEMTDDCDMVEAPGGPSDVSLMIVRDTLVRFDVIDSITPTTTGLRVGSTEAEVLATYDSGRVRVEPHAYDGPEGHYLIVRVGADSLHGIVFETDGRRLTQYRAGRWPEVGGVEGCL
jgi:hypothetical protein